MTAAPDVHTESDDGQARRPPLRRVLAQFAPHKLLLAVAGASIVTEVAVATAAPLVLGRAIERGVVGRNVSETTRGAALYFGLGLVQVVLTNVQQKYTGYLAQRYLGRLRRQLLEKLYSLDIDFFGREPSGRIVARLTSDVDSLQQFAETGMALVLRASLVFSMTVVTMLFVSVPLTVVLLLTLVPLALTSVWYRRRAYGAQLVVRERNAQLLTHANESLSGVRVVQAYAVEGARYQDFSSANGLNYDAKMESVRLSLFYQPLVDALGPFSLATVFALGSVLAGRGTVAVGVIVAFTLYIGRLFEPIQQATELAHLLQSASASFTRVFSFLDRKPLVADAEDATSFVEGPGAIEVRAVCFAYPGSPDQPVLQDIDLTVAPGERIALVGDSGAGKSTLAKLIARNYDPTSGVVVVDGQDLRTVELSSLRRSVTLVSQEGYLFDGTVEDNIVLGRPGATAEDAIHAAEALGIQERLDALPEGMQTKVTSGGQSLSAGQRQLVALARAMVSEPKVLILDEATSQLDPATDALVERALARLLADRTSVVIAHRVGTALQADRVALLRDGRIVEVGPPATLMAAGGAFAEWALHGEHGGRAA